MRSPSHRTGERLQPEAHGTPTFDLRCSDSLHTNKTDAIVYGYREMTTHNPARRTIVLNLTWKFNKARSKYRGSSAGGKQKARM
ncbi:MAG: hypothetical protein IKH88_06590 [Prevotella sp.]|nr:hypothetical protein [Prevotella sp.]